MQLIKFSLVITLGLVIGALSFGTSAEANRPTTVVSAPHSVNLQYDRNGTPCYFGMSSLRKPACQCPDGYQWVGWSKVRLTKEDTLEAVCLRQ